MIVVDAVDAVVVVVDAVDAVVVVVAAVVYKTLVLRC